MSHGGNGTSATLTPYSHDTPCARLRRVESRETEHFAELRGQIERSTSDTIELVRLLDAHVMQLASAMTEMHAEIRDELRALRSAQKARR